jgi:hypothetical protein
MMLFSNACRLIICSLLSLSVHSETVRGAHRKLTSSVNLGSAENYVILAKTGISTVPDSAITGDIAVSPIDATAMTGFSLTADSTEEFSTSAQITGSAYAANYNTPTPALLTAAVGAMETAYLDAEARDNNEAARIDLGGGTLGGAFGGATTQLTPGIYTFGSDVAISASIYFKGSNTDIFIIQIEGNLEQIANTQVILEDGALAKNIFWQVSGKVTVGTDAQMKGILLVKTDVLFKTGSSLSGRVLAQTACNLQKATISAL